MLAPSSPRFSASLRTGVITAYDSRSAPVAGSRSGSLDGSEDVIGPSMTLPDHSGAFGARKAVCAGFLRTGAPRPSTIG